ncbi:hypothetical protein LQW54_010611 [Pestalotiopsis sp. IQ-011]
MNSQFDEVCAYFDIPSTASGAEKLACLRAVSWRDLVAAIGHLANHTRVPAGRRPGGRLPATTERILEHYALPETEEDLDEWRGVFGSIIADGQVLAPSRGLWHHLHRHGVPPADIWRYQASEPAQGSNLAVAKRLSFITEKVAPASFGVSHAMDKPWWNFSIQHGPTPKEMELMEEWLDILIAFAAHDDRKYDFGTRAIDEFKVVTSDNVIEIQQDTKWGHLVKLSEIFASD